MDARSPRWVSVTDSEFAHERAGLEHVRALLPDRAPYRAWSNIEFRDSSGKWHEVDLLVLGERRLHLVELKHYQGTITGTAYRWQRNGRSEDSPLLLARRKAQRLKDVIVRAIDDMGGDGRQATPFVQECVFLHAPNGRCNLPPDQRTDLFGLDGATHSGLPSIAARLLERPDANRAAPRLIENNDLAAKLFARIGFAQRREHEVGTWRIIGPPDDEGADWQDWPAEHVKVRSEQVRIRFFVHPEHSPKSDDDARARLVEREYELTHRLRHDGLIVPRDLVVDDLGTGLVFDREPDAARLDLWLADRGRSLTLSERLGLIRQLAEALDYAHRNNVVHRGLTPEAIWISGDPPVLRIADWQLAGRAGEVVTSHPTDGSTTRLFRDMTPSTDLRERQAGGYLAPEDHWAPGIDRVRIDVFGLGAVAYAVLTGRAPGEHTADLQERLRRDNGLDLAADLPEVSPGLRRLVLDATRPKVSDRYAGVAAFRSALDLVEHDAVVVTTVPDDDPLEAVAGTRLDDRFTLVRRLGSGSTAVGMLVTDATAPDRNRVLKVARDDAAVPRLTSEAAALQALPADPQLVRLIEPEPLTVGTRRALLLESAGERTLAEELRDRPRLSLDLQQRWGTDLLRALVALDRAGIDHRDIKPANLGVRERRTGGSNREKHLVLFDFSLARAGAGDTNAGTPPYLDPFLGHGARVRWDSAAERYAASVTLFEMATGQPPQFADDGTAAIMTDDEAHIDDGMFDASVAASLADFFRRALRREAGKRFDTAAEMLSAWSAAFAVEFTRLPEEADAMAAAAALGTPLAASGLSARALSAIEPLRVNTVGDLVAVDPAQLTSLKGSARDTRAEVRTRAKQWRERFATGSGIVGDAQPHEVLLDDVERIARLIVRRCEDRPAPGRTRVIRAVLALGDHDPAGPVDAPAAESRQGSAAAHPAVDPFASLADIAAATGLQGAPTVWLHISKAIELLAGDEESRRVLDAVLAQVEALLAAAGGLLPAAALGAGLVPGVGADRPDAAARRQRIMAGLARLALDRADQAERNDGDPSPIARRRRRRDGSVLLAAPPALLDIADPLGRLADAMVASTDPIIATARTAQRLRELWPQAMTGPDDVTLVRLAAAVSDRAAASQRGELHARSMSPVDAARIALAGLSLAEPVGRDDLRGRISSRFPALSALPSGAAFDDLLTRADIPVEWDGTRYRPLRPVRSTAGVTSTAYSVPAMLAARSGDQHEDRVLAESRETCSFVALGVHPRDLDRGVTALTVRFGARQVDLTSALITGLRAQGKANGIGWDLIEAADAEPDPTSTPALGLRSLVDEALPGVYARVDELAAAEPVGTAAVLLTDAAPLARYGHLADLARYADPTSRRRQAVWLLFPLDGADTAAAIDGMPVPLGHGGQFLRLDHTWVQATLDTIAHPTVSDPTVKAGR